MNMATISIYDDIFVLHAPGKKEGETVDILDVDNKARRVRLTRPIGENFTFVWVDDPQQSDGPEATFTYQDGEFLRKTAGQHSPGDRVTVTTQKGVTQEHVLGERAGDNTFYRCNHFSPNKDGDQPKWFVRTYNPRARPGDVVNVYKLDGTSQKQKLVTETKPGFWTAKKA